MKVRGERECKQCGTRWSYYETGSVECPECGSLRSVGRDERREHTADPVELDLSPVRADVDEEPVGDLAERAAAICREYVRRDGFVHAGELRPLPDRFVAAMELRHVGAEIARAMRVTDDDELYFLSLLRGVEDGDRPTPVEVPESLAPARGLAVAATLEAYHRDIVRANGDDVDPAVRDELDRLRSYRKRIEALDGDVEPREAERYLRAMQEVGAYLTDGDETALANARSRLDEAP